jgi:hypothetical protein
MAILKIGFIILYEDPLITDGDQQFHVLVVSRRILSEVAFSME